MGPRTERRVRGWSLTKRLTVALSVGACFVAVVLGFLGSDRDVRRLSEQQAADELRAATAMAERAAPLLDRGDLMRLSVLAATVRDQFGSRALVLDHRGRVAIDTALVLGDKQMSLMTNAAPFQRRLDRVDAPPRRETLAPIRFGGEAIGEVRLQCDLPVIVAGFDLTWFGLVLLSCLTLVAAAAMIVHHWSFRVRSATDAMIRLAAGEVAGSPGQDSESELQDLGYAMRELERGMQDGLQRVGEGYVGMALQVVQSLEQRRLVPPGHGERTARLASRMAERLQLLEADRQDLDLACRLVDLGKASVRASILQKSGPLTENESTSLEHHPVHAAEQLDRVPALRRAAKIVRHQLERYDGRGTPDGLRGDRLPLGARVLAIASAFDLLTTCAEERPLEWQQALDEMALAKGQVFDPWLFDLFREEVERDPPQSSDRDVMIVPSGALPWRAIDSADADDDADDGEFVDELEVMSDDAPAEDQS